MNNKFTCAEYIWLDGTVPTQQLRSKTRVLPFNENPSLEHFPEWGFDGSSTNQAEGKSSDCILKPVSFFADPLSDAGNHLVLCEVMLDDKTPHPSNKRALLRNLMDKGGREQNAYMGFEQEYTFFHLRGPLGWPDNGYPAPQGPFYCGVGSDKAFGREIVTNHTNACIKAGICIFGTNAEVMPGQWEFQVGYRGVESEAADPLTVADHTWLARFLLHKIAETKGITISFDNKPVKGDWNGAGMHTNFSTAAMRDQKTGRNSIEIAIERLGNKHQEHINDYGHGLDERLTGDHETCAISEFRYGTSDRGASIRIPLNVSQKGYGYIEDRRPGANADPYIVAARLLGTICNL